MDRSATLVKVAIGILTAAFIVAGNPVYADDPAYSDESVIICGNINQSIDGKINLADITDLVGVVYLGGEVPLIAELANVDGSADHSINLADITRLISFVYLDHSPLACPPVHFDSKSDCGTLAHSLSMGEMHVEVIDNNLHLFHTNASYNCCLDYSVDLLFDGHSITAVELDSGPPCDCYCLFDLESTIYLLAPGEYYVTLIDTQGDTVGVDTAVILGDFALVNWGNSECGMEGTNVLALADIIWTYSGGELSMEHADAIFNCGLDLELEIAMTGDTIRIFERNQMPLEGRFKCDCNYQVSALLTGVPTGSWVLEVYQNDWPIVGQTDQLVDRQTFTFSN